MKLQMKYTYRETMMDHTCTECGEEIKGEGVHVMAHAGAWAEHTAMCIHHMSDDYQARVKTKPVHLSVDLPV